MKSVAILIGYEEFIYDSDGFFVSFKHSSYYKEYIKQNKLLVRLLKIKKHKLLYTTNTESNRIKKLDKKINDKKKIKDKLFEDFLLDLAHTYLSDYDEIIIEDSNKKRKEKSSNIQLFLRIIKSLSSSYKCNIKFEKSDIMDEVICSKCRKSDRKNTKLLHGKFKCFECSYSANKHTNKSKNILYRHLNKNSNKKDEIMNILSNIEFKPNELPF